MAIGLPDYLRGIRPRYGGSKLSEGQVFVWDGVLTGLVQINGRGMVYGGTVWLDSAETQANSEVWLGIDGVNIEGLSFERLKAYKIYDSRKAVISLNQFDQPNYVYSVGIAYGLTFETRLDLKYYENYGRRVTVHYRIVYALI